jgi:hemoglobin
MTPTCARAPIPFDGVNIDKLKVKIGAFFAMATGGPSGYAGRSMRDAHARLPANGLDGEIFDSFVGLFEGVLKELGVQDSNVGQVMALLRGARNDVLGR